MPESVSTVDAILDGLREKARRGTVALSSGERQRIVPLADAVAAVHAAADARTQEIVDHIRLVCHGRIRTTSKQQACEDLAAEVARRFPNGGTPDAG